MPEATVRRTQQERRAETERRVLNAAMTLIAERGSHSVSLAEVGRLAGYSSGIVSHHFGGRPQLLAAVVRRAQQFDVPTIGTSGLDQLTTLVSTYLTTLQERAPAPQAFLLMWSEAIASDPVLAPLFAERDAWFRDLLAGIVQRGVDDSSIRPDADPGAIAVSLLGLLRGVGLQLVSAAEHAPLDVISDQTVEMIRRGLVTTGPAGS